MSEVESSEVKVQSECTESVSAPEVASFASTRLRFSLSFEKVASLLRGQIFSRATVVAVALAGRSVREAAWPWADRFSSGAPEVRQKLAPCGSAGYVMRKSGKRRRCATCPTHTPKT